MTRKELSDALTKIGWRISQSGNGLNDFIVNHKGEKTDLVAYGDMLQIRRNLFGGDSSLGKGDFVIHLEELTYQIGGDNGLDEFVALNFGERNYINLYNHEKSFSKI